jgi:hypothetical protein
MAVRKGYIAVEPDLHVERVPDRLLDSETISWPPGYGMPEMESGKGPPIVSVSDLYSRSRLLDFAGEVFVWSTRPHNDLPDSVTAQIKDRAARESDILDRLPPFDYQGHSLEARIVGPHAAITSGTEAPKVTPLRWTFIVDGVQTSGPLFTGSEEEHQVRSALIKSLAATKERNGSSF